MATHSSVLAWRIPGTGEPGGLPSMGSHRVRHDWSDLAAAAAGKPGVLQSTGSQRVGHDWATELNLQQKIGKWAKSKWKDRNIFNHERNATENHQRVVHSGFIRRGLEAAQASIDGRTYKRNCGRVQQWDMPLKGTNYHWVNLKMKAPYTKGMCLYLHLYEQQAKLTYSGKKSEYCLPVG